MSQPSPSSLAERRIELGKLLGEERAHERLVDHDVGIPLGHRSNLPCQRAAALCEAPPVHWQLVALAVVLLVFAAISQRIEGTWITAPMFFMAAGLVVGVEALDLVDPASTGLEVKTLAEATLTVVLFSDASRIDLQALRSALGVPARLLGIGLPLTIIAGFVAAIVLFGDLAWPEALVLAIILAPTDAALGQVVVTSRRLPVRVRQSLNVESGLNDGICVPLFLIALAVALAEEGAIGNGHAAQLVAEKIGYGVLGGVVAGAAAAAIVVYAGGRRFVDETWLQVVPLAGALLAFALAEAIGGSGFIAAFVGGAIFGGLRRHRGGDVSQLTEQAGAVLAAVTFVVFGAVLLGPALHDLTWQIALYAVLSLTVVRMLPVALAMLGTGARRPTVAFLGWFGPRGAASIVFALLVLEEGGLRNEELILTTAFVTVGLSVLAHGATAAPLAARYGSWLESRSPQELSELESGERGRDPLAAPTRHRSLMRLVSKEEARRIAVRAQLLDGSATTVLDTVRRLGFLQIDPISTVAPPQQLVLWSRLGPYDVDRARPPALGRAQALRVERVHLADRVAAARAGSDAAAAAQPALRARAVERRVPRATTRASSATCCASSTATGRCRRASSSTNPLRGPTSRTAGGEAAR